MLAAGVDGIEQEIEPADPVERNQTGDQPRLPQSPGLPLQALERDNAIVEALESEFVRGYTAAKRRELAAFRDEVIDREREYYAEML